MTGQLNISHMHVHWHLSTYISHCQIKSVFTSP